MFQTVIQKSEGEKLAINVRFEYIHKRKQHRTICFLEDSLTGIVYSVGKSKCHASDVFDKNEGRQKAMDRALKSCNGLSRNDRSLVWRKYNEVRTLGANKWEVKRWEPKREKN